MSIFATMRELNSRNVRAISQGMASYLKQPGLRNSWGGPFNGQKGRREIFDEMVKELRPAFICETGTYRGTTAAYIASTYAVPFLTIEALPHNFGFSMGALWRRWNATQLIGDSRAALARIAMSRSSKTEAGLFYLDAHWQDDLPLQEEIEIICSNWSEALILVDDFRVDDDSGYAFDDYGPGKVLSLEYLHEVMQKFRLKAYWPKIGSTSESGARRGCVVIAHGLRVQAEVGRAKTVREVS